MPRQRLESEAEAAAPSVVDVTVRVPRGWAIWLGQVAAPVAAIIAIVTCIKRDVPLREAVVIVPLVGFGVGFGTCFLVSLALAWDEIRAHREARPKPPQAQQDSRPEPPLRAVPIIIKRDTPMVHERYGGLPIPKQGPEALARYFWRILREDRTLAFRNPYHIGRDEVQALKDFFTDPENGLGEDLGGNLGVKPNDEGADLMRQFVKRHYPDAHLP